MEFEAALRREIQRVKARLRELEGLAGTASGRRRTRKAAKQPARSASARHAPPARKPVSAKRRAAQQRQGRYLAAVRTLTPAQRAEVKRVRAEKGFAVAIAQAKKLAS